MAWTNHKSGFDSRQGKNFNSSPLLPHLHWGATGLAIYRTKGAVSQEVNRTEPGADHVSVALNLRIRGPKYLLKFMRSIYGA